MPKPRFICTVAPAAGVSPEAALLRRKWISEGLHAGMDYLDRYDDLRTNPAGLLEGARTLVALAFPYPPRDPGSAACHGIAEYALGDDYHEALREYMNPLIERWKAKGGGEWRLCIDSAPIMERYHAVASGLARLTRSGNVMVPGLGTRLFLAMLLTTLSEEETLQAIADDCGTDGNADGKEGILRSVPSAASCGPEEMIREVCGDCRRCLGACPGRAIRPGALIDARRCLSYLTIEHRGDWTEAAALEVTSSTAGRKALFGCDACVRVCPLNSLPDSPAEPLPAFKAREAYVNLTPLKIVEMTQEEFSATFRRSAIKRAKLAGMRRNAANCLGLLFQITDNTLPK